MRNLRLDGVSRRLGGAGVAAAAAVIAAGLLFPAGLAAQTLPTEALPGVVEKPAPGVPEGIEEEGVGVEGVVPKPEEIAGADEVVATLTSVNISGVKVLKKSTVQAVAEPYLNRPVTRGEIAQLKFDIARLYYDKGYILVRVVTPPQDLSDGSLDIVVYEATVGNLQVRQDNLLRPYVVNALTSRVKSGEVFRESTVESMVNDFNDLNNVDATLNLMPGSAVGTTDLVLNLDKVKEDEQRVSVDNYGSELTGDIVGTINLEKTNLLRLGEKLDLDFTATDEGTYTIQGAVKVPIGFRNVMFEARALHSEIEIGDRLEALNADGQTDIYDVGFSSRLINMRRQIAEVRIGFQARSHQSDIANVLDTDDNIRQVFGEGTYLARFPNLLLFGSLRLAQGVDILDASDKGKVNATRALGDPEVLLVQPLIFVNYRPIPKGELRVQASGQYASDTVLSSDLFILGGYGSARGFEPAETTGDSGVQFTVEYDHTLYSWNYRGSAWSALAGPFVDGGHVFNRQNGQVQDSTLVSAGFGAEITTDVSRVGDTKLRFDLAFPLGSYDSPQVNNQTVYLRFIQTF